MVERHPYTVDTGVQFSNEVPTHATVAERPNATDCKSVKPGVQIPPVAPKYIRASLPKYNDKLL